MNIETRAPVRIDFAGGWSDVPSFADTRGGEVANAAIALFTRVRCRTGGETIALRADDIGEVVTVPAGTALAYDGQLDLHKAALTMLPVTGGVNLSSSSAVPAGSGLGASGSLGVSLLATLACCRGEEMDAAEVAEMAFLLETAELGLDGGRQDQYAAALGGFLGLTFGGGAGVYARQLKVSREAANDLAEHMLIVYTGQSHFSPETHRRVWRAYHDGDRDVAEAIGTIRDLVASACMALESGDWRGLATVIDENWTQQQRLDDTIRTETMAQIERAVRGAGAWGLKATGAGAGGCMVVLFPSERRPAVEEAVTAAGGRVLQWNFEFEGVQSRRTDDDAGNVGD